MKHTIHYITALLLFSANLCLAGFLYVPSQYLEIQSAINSATDGDTILLQEGRYYENINFNGKNIALASVFVIDGDTSHISKTLIDSQGLGRVITIENGERPYIAGLSICNGNAEEGPGVYIHFNSSIHLYKCLIFDNNASKCIGGICNCGD